MRDFYFFTSRPIVLDDCIEDLRKEIKNITIGTDGNVCCINGKWLSFLYFQNDNLDDFVFESKEQLEEFKRHIPIQNPYANDFETHRSIDAKRVIKALMTKYKDLYINVDDLSDWFGTAQEYIDTEFDY